jgi:hypothetical protein
MPRTIDAMTEIMYAIGGTANDIDTSAITALKAKVADSKM